MYRFVMSLTVLGVVLLASTSAGARPPQAPLSSHQTLPGVTADRAWIGGTPNDSLDVVVSGGNRDWRWNVNTGASYVVSSMGETSQRGSAHGHYVALVRDSKWGVHDLRTDSFQYHDQALGDIVIHNGVVVWVTKNGISWLNVPTQTPGSRATPEFVDGLSLWDGWLTFRYVSPQTGELNVEIQRLSTGQDYGYIDPGFGPPEVAQGKVVYAHPKKVVWEYIGHPSTRRHVDLPADCTVSNARKVGGAEGQFVLHVATGCPSGVPELRVVNIHTSRSYFIAEVVDRDAAFDVQGNAVTYVDRSDMANVVVLSEADM